jgi:hypothetical protein
MFKNGEIEKIDEEILNLKNKRDQIYTDLVKEQLLKLDVNNKIVDSIILVTYERVEYTWNDNFDIYATISFSNGYDMSYKYNRWSGETKVEINGRQEWNDIDKFYTLFEIEDTLNDEGDYVNKSRQDLGIILEVISGDKYVDFSRFSY